MKRKKRDQDFEIALRQSMELENSPNFEQEMLAMKTKAGGHLMSGISQLDKSLFKAALKEFENGMSVILKAPDPYKRFRDEILYISMYHQIVHLLILVQNYRDQKLYRQSAWLLARTILEICLSGNHQMMGNHQMILVKAAIKSNFLIGNFLTAGKFIQFLLTNSNNMPDAQAYQKALAKCQEENFKESHSPYPSDKPLPMCYQTGRVIRESKYLSCSVCKANFSISKIENPQCMFCKSFLAPKEFSTGG